MEISGSVLTVVFIAELFLFAFLAKKLHQGFYLIFLRLTGSESSASKLFALLFLPGTFIHELSHFLMAKILFVYTSGMEFKPVVSTDAIKLGSVSIAKTDLLRRMLIGGAPFLVGLLLILGSLFILFYNLNLIYTLPWWVIALVVFTYFEVGNTMFSSRKDLEGSLVILGVIMLLLIGLYLMDWFAPLVILKQLLDSNSKVISTGCLLMLVPSAINLVLLILIKPLKTF